LNLVLHLYETLGWWRKVDWLKVHFAESWNELHHLLIMESLGGNKHWVDRFIAKSTALVMVACQQPDAQNTFKSPHTLTPQQADAVLPPITDREVELASVHHY
jgi:3-methyladenine DNA glycosylase AlkD